MKLPVSILCDRATVREGLLHILGGGVTNVTLPSLPAAPDLDLALFLTGDNAQEFEGTHKIAVRVVNSTSQEAIATVELSWEGPEADFSYDGPAPSLPITVPLRGMQLREYGKYEVIVAVDGAQMMQLALYAVEPDAAMRRLLLSQTRTGPAAAE